MKIMKEAGTGKTFVIKCLQKLLKKSGFYSATTGSAGRIIDAGTIHSLLDLPTHAHQKNL